MFIAVATFAGHKYATFYRKTYKMFYIGGFIMQTIEEDHGDLQCILLEMIIKDIVDQLLNQTVKEVLDKLYPSA